MDKTYGEIGLHVAADVRVHIYDCDTDKQVACCSLREAISTSISGNSYMDGSVGMDEETILKWTRAAEILEAEVKVIRAVIASNCIKVKANDQP